MADSDGPRPSPIDWSTQGSDYPDLAPKIELVAPPKTKHSNVNRIRFNAVYFGVFGVWALGLAFTGTPLYGALSAIVLFEMALAALRVSGETGQVVADPEVFDRLKPILIELSTRARCAPPRILLRSDTIRVAAVRRIKGDLVLQLSCPYVKSVDDPQLRGIVAHELIHIVHNDLRMARVRAAIAAFSGFAIGVVAWIAVGYELKNLPIFFAASIVGILLIRLALSPMNRHKEVRADLQGAVLSGNPLALAEALEIAHAQSIDTRRRLYGRQPWRSILYPVSWSMPTHPRMSDRIDALRAMGSTTTNDDAGANDPDIPALSAMTSPEHKATATRESEGNRMRSFWPLVVGIAVAVAVAVPLIVLASRPSPASPVDRHARVACQAIQSILESALGGPSAATAHALQELQTAEVQGSDSANAALSSAAQTISAASTASSLGAALDHAESVCQSLRLGH